MTRLILGLSDFFSVVVRGDFAGVLGNWCFRVVFLWSRYGGLGGNRGLRGLCFGKRFFAVFLIIF
jgi:hypothetical protein